MARGLSRDLAQEKNHKKNASKNQGNTEGLSAAQRAERDAKVMQEKAAAKAKAREEMAASGAEGAAAVKAAEEKKKQQRDAKKERAANSTQAAKQNRKAGVRASALSPGLLACAVRTARTPHRLWPPAHVPDAGLLETARGSHPLRARRRARGGCWARRLHAARVFRVASTTSSSRSTS